MKGIRKYLDIIEVVLVICFFIFLIFILNYMFLHREAFTENPFIYGANRIGDVRCSCFVGERGFFTFNETWMGTDPVTRESRRSINSMNLTLLEEVFRNDMAS